ncbi:MAG: IPT/TIG domain-containing protein [Planctomycetes bacterium]|nr:IPT/TIG domain-containing protein [Planctomycetota bacterium]
MRILPLLLLAPVLVAAERINHAGRILGPEPTVTTPVLFNTPQADAIVSALQIMPKDNPWNEVITNRPVHADSGIIMGRIRSDLVAISSNRNTLKVFAEMNYVLVPPAQANIGIRFTEYPDDSDFNGGTSPVATWPIPTNMPVETWPSNRPAGESNETWQRTVIDQDRHSIIVQPGATPRLFETWQAVLTNNTPNWQASNGAIFRYDSNALRTAGGTSGDAAGLPLFPALIRYDECERGVIEHALRIVVNKSRKQYIYPATHHASPIDRLNDDGSINLSFPSYPAMGQRVRLKSSFSVPAGWSKQSRAVANALKKYGALVADNGGFFSVSVCPDQRFPAGCFNDVQTIDINQFDVISTTGASEGPRAAGGPNAGAGADQNVQLARGAMLNGTASGGGITTTWSLYDPAGAPGTVTIAAPSSVKSTVTFSAAGAYTFLLTVTDGTHTPAYDAVVITALDGGEGNPEPTLSAISPESLVAGSGTYTMTLMGSNLLPSSVVTWTGQAALLPITATDGEITVTVPASYVTSGGNPEIRVVNPTPGGGTSAALTVTITAAVGGGGGGPGGSGSGGGGCGIGALSALMMLGLGFGLRGWSICVQR